MWFGFCGFYNSFMIVFYIENGEPADKQQLKVFTTHIAVYITIYSSSTELQFKILAIPHRQTEHWYTK